VGKWLLFNANWAIFQLAYIMARPNYIQWNDGNVRFVLDQHSDFHSASSLKQQSAGRHVASLGHIILIPSQSLLLLLNAACLAEKQQKPIL
jgi:hypothetical protein